MASLDLNTATRVFSGGGDFLDSVGTQFGVPDCLLGLAKGALELLPTAVLMPINKRIEEGRRLASNSMAKYKKKILMENGIIEIDTDGGTIRFVSDSSDNKLEAGNGLEELGDFVEAAAAAAQFGADLYTNVMDTYDQIQGIYNCINGFVQTLKSEKGQSFQLNTAEQNLAQFEGDMLIIRDTQDFIRRADETISNINSIILARLQDPTNEPIIDPTFLDQDSPLYFSSVTTPEQVEVFRLVFGPPKSKSGQFLYSVDGLYYDSQKGGLPEVNGTIVASERYQFKYPSNLGGKGDLVSLEDINQYVGTLFDPNVIDDSLDLQTHYNADHFLQVLLGQKHRNLYTLSGQVQSLIDSGYTEDSAMVENMRQQIYSVASQHNKKINKRKKQIEIAVKAPTVLGGKKVFNFGEVPINDFSYLSKINLAAAYETQNKLMFKQAEVSGVVLPLQPKYVKAAEGEGVATLSHLVVPPIGNGSIIYDEGSTSGTVLSLTDSVVTDGLIAIYNFLESDVTTPGSTTYTTLNCISKTNNDKAAQLYATSPDRVFTKGLGIPYLQGMVTLDASTNNPNGLGSIIQLPNIKEYQNLFYSNEGCTVDFWIHMPDLLTSSNTTQLGSAWGRQNFHRIVFGCENTGGESVATDAAYAQVDYGADSVRGLVCGFTRDRQIVSDLIPSNTTSQNPLVASGVHFYIAPTRSVNTSDVTFIRNTIGIDCSTSAYSIHKCSIPITTEVNGKKFSDASSTFVHVSIVTAPKENNIKIYLDGTLMVTSSIPQVFGCPDFTAPKIPSFAKVNSFNYNTSTTGLAIFEQGPRVTSFTPWMIGGGFTDGAFNLGGFMGDNSGLDSGLKGHVGSFKFYSRALNSSEVLSNYTNQSGFFKNIDI